MTDTPAPKSSDLKVRTLSAIVMVAVAGAALWLNGWFWTTSVALVGLGMFWEWRRLADAISTRFMGRTMWYLGGLVYVGLGCAFLGVVGNSLLIGGPVLNGPLLLIVASVVATDICAYFAGRTIGGPKIAPTISPNKTWAGLGGGIAGASLVVGLNQFLSYRSALAKMHEFGADALSSQIPFGWKMIVIAGPTIAIVAQAGDFLESWMKRRAGVKDSGNLIPGHGGLFDRLDGLIAVSFLSALIPVAFYAYDVVRLGYWPE